MDAILTSPEDFSLLGEAVQVRVLYPDPLFDPQHRQLLADLNCGLPHASWVVLQQSVKGRLSRLRHALRTACI